ncbi:MAG: DUF4190 domain-containing protein [Chitinophagaceae bacterium]
MELCGKYAQQCHEIIKSRQKKLKEKITLVIVPFISFIIVTSFVSKNNKALENLPTDIQKNIFLLKTAFTQEELLKASTEDIKIKIGIEMSENTLKKLKNTMTYKSKITHKNNKNNSESDSNNIFAILGFVLAFLISIAGLVLSIIGLNKSKQMGGKGRGISIASIVISSLSFLIIIIVIISVAATFASVAAI